MDQQQTNDNTPIQISILESQLKDKVVSYLIKGEDKLGQFEANRRFNDFFNLRQALSSRWPGCYIPPVPSKQTIGNTENKVIEDRKRFLQYFCEQISQYKYLFYSDEFQTFLRTKNSDIEKVNIFDALNSLPKQSIVEINNKYRSNFAQLNGKEINTEMSFKTTGFGNYLVKSSKALETLKNQVKGLTDAKKRYNEQFTNLTQVLIPEYEKNIMSEYTTEDKDLVFSNNNEVNMAAREIRDSTATQNNYEMISDMIRCELKEVEAFQEALVQKESYEKLRQAAFSTQKDNQQELSKLLAGKTTFKSMFSKGSNPEQISVVEKKIADIQSEVDNLTQLIDIITVLMGYDLIDQFKINKTKKYMATMLLVSQLELELNNKHINMWKQVSDTIEV